MKPEQFIREFGVDKARDLLTQRDRYVNVEKPTHFDTDLNIFFHIDDITELDESDVDLSDLKRLVESLDRYNKFENKQEALDAITNAPNGSTHYRKLSSGTRYTKQGPRFFEYWNDSEWCRPTVPFTDETHILRFDKLDDLKQSIKDHESIYGGE